MEFNICLTYFIGYSSTELCTSFEEKTIWTTTKLDNNSYIYSKANLLTLKRFHLVICLFLILGSYSMIGQDKLLGDSEKPYLIKSIFFSGGSYYIDEEQKESVFEFLNGALLENYEIHIHSHTDNIGSRKFNEYLSQMRSGASYQMLEQGGYIMDNIFIKDHGFDNPEFDNATYEGRAQNRRVDIVLWPLPL